MDRLHVDSLKLFVDGLTLVYHEARNVRFLIKDGLPAVGWENLISLPRNRVEAWKELQSVRQAARSRSSARKAVEVFQERFRSSLNELELLYRNPKWKHASAYGGHAWRGVTAVVFTLGQAIDRSDQAAIDEACASLLTARHNNGTLRRKILELDHAVDATTDPWWQDAASSA